MKILQPIESNLFQELIDRPDLIISQSIDIQIAVAQDIQTPRSLLQILVDRAEPKIAEIAKLHINYAGELTTDGQSEIDAIFKTVHLGQNDRLAVELLKIGGVPAEFLSEWVPANKLIEALKNPHLSTIDRVKFLARLAEDKNLEPRLEVAESIDTPAGILGQLLGDIELAVRLATQHNPNCPVDLCELIGSQQSIASNWDTDPAELAILGKSYWSWIRLKVAQNPSASTEILRELALDRVYKIQLAVANNPNTPAEMLELLLSDSELKRHFLTHSNAIQNLLLNSNSKEKSLLKAYRLLLDRYEYDNLKITNQVLSRRPNSPYFLAQVLKTGNLNDKIAAARNPNTPISILKQLAKDPDETIRSVISGNSNLPLESLLELAEDSTVNIRATLARNISCHQVPITLLERLVTDESAKVRSIIAANFYTPIRELRQLANDIDYEVKKSLVTNQNTPVEVLNQLGLEEGIFDVRNPNTPGAVLDRAVKMRHEGQSTENNRRRRRSEANVTKDGLEDFSRYQNNIMKTSLEDLLKYPVKGSQMPSETLVQLINSTNSSVRYHVAFHPNTPASALAKLAYDDYSPVRAGVAENRNTPPEVLLVLLRREKEHYLDQNYYGTICNNVAGRANLPSEVLFELARNESERIRQSVVHRPELPISLLEWFVENEQDETVLRSLASRTDLTSNLLDRLSENSNPQVLIAISSSPNITSQLWVKLADNESVEVRSSIASSPLTPSNILDSLSTDIEMDVREKLAINRNTPTSILDRLATDNELNVRIAIALNPNTSIDTLDRLADDEKIEVRRAVFRNPQTPESIKDKLRDLLPQSIARSQSTTLCSLPRIYNPQTDDLPTILSEYAQSENVFVRLVILRHPLTPIEILEQGRRSSEWLDRYAVADNPSTPSQIRQQLTQDSNRIVRAISIANLG